MMPTTQATLPVISVDDNFLIGEVIRLLLAGLPEFRHVRHYSSGEGVRDTVKRENIRLVVLDYEIPGTDTMKLLRDIVSIAPECKVVMMSAHGRRDIVEACQAAGAAGYMLKSSDPSQLVAGLRRAAASESGEFFLINGEEHLL